MRDYFESFCDDFKINRHFLKQRFPLPVTRIVINLLALHILPEKGSVTGFLSYPPNNVYIIIVMKLIFIHTVLESLRETHEKWLYKYKIYIYKLTIYYIDRRGDVRHCWFLQKPRKNHFYSFCEICFTVYNFGIYYVFDHIFYTILCNIRSNEYIKHYIDLHFLFFYKQRHWCYQYFTSLRNRRYSISLQVIFL